LATVDAQGPNGAITTMQYVLRLTDDASGPLVAELLPGPPSIAGGEQ
jgi:hypothetical protein